MYGNKYLEQKFVTFLRNWFLLPFKASTPVHLLKFGGEQRFIDQMDRDYEFWEYNAHPFQLFFYSFYNQLRLKQVEDAQLRSDGLEPMEDQVLRVSNERVAQEAQSTGRDVDRMRQVQLIRPTSSCRLLEKLTQLPTEITSLLREISMIS